MHDGLEVTPDNPLGLMKFTCRPSGSGDSCEYEVATIPPVSTPGWRAAPDGATINFSLYPSRVCEAPIRCLGYGDFSYFQTFVNVPRSTEVTEFTILFEGMDDGSRVTLFNSQYPQGLVVPGSYVYGGETGRTANLAPYVHVGEINRVVITQVDDCCKHNTLRSAVVRLNGQEIPTGCMGPADCDDGNACTEDVCNPGGSCSNPLVSCDDGDACTLDACEPVRGCYSVEQCPDCSAAASTAAVLWSPDHELVPVGVMGVNDPQGQVVEIRMDAINQDEPSLGYGDGNTCADASGVGESVALVRAERSGTSQTPGNGRIYHLSFTATDPDGYSCAGVVTTCVPHDQGGQPTCIDEGPLYDSLVCLPESWAP